MTMQWPVLAVLVCMLSTSDRQQVEASFPARCVDASYTKWCKCTRDGIGSDVPYRHRAVLGRNNPVFTIEMWPEGDHTVHIKPDEKDELQMTCKPKFLNEVDAFNTKWLFGPWCTSQYWFFRKNRKRIPLDKPVTDFFDRNVYDQFWWLMEWGDYDTPRGVLENCAEPCSIMERPHERFSNSSYEDRYNLTVKDLVWADGKEFCCHLGPSYSSDYTYPKCVNISYIRESEIKIDCGDSELELKEIYTDYDGTEQHLLYLDNVDSANDYAYITTFRASVEGFYPGTGTFEFERIQGPYGTYERVKPEPDPKSGGRLFNVYSRLLNQPLGHRYILEFKAVMTYRETSQEFIDRKEIKITKHKSCIYMERCTAAKAKAYCKDGATYDAVPLTDPKKPKQWDCVCSACPGFCTGNRCDIDPYASAGCTAKCPSGLYCHRIRCSSSTYCSRSQPIAYAQAATLTEKDTGCDPLLDKSCVSRVTGKGCSIHLAKSCTGNIFALTIVVMMIVSHVTM